MGVANQGFGEYTSPLATLFYPFGIFWRVYGQDMPLINQSHNRDCTTIIAITIAIPFFS